MIRPQIHVSESRSIDTEKETANEVQERKVDGLYVHPELENEKEIEKAIIEQEQEISEGNLHGGDVDTSKEMPLYDIASCLLG
ncbi:hypothetical protein Ddye_028984 [Dipteronia dyeriana]|uniref:Uncharacterized protein n=1 Tax=Dipteronia dyeriana TaxID=168575 RepID=A0AAD9TDQ8_9ROSI|nr:hypothetical protein Ddye_028984 [Dipteronia dyeriana]